MKILFLITKSDVGGAQKYVRDLAASLPHETFETDIVTGGPDGVHFLSNAFRSYFLFLNDIAAVIEIVCYLRKHRPDILHLNSSKAGVVGAIAAKIHNAICHLSRFLRNRVSSTTRSGPFTMSHVPCRPVRVVFTAHGWVFNPENRYGWLRQRLYILFHKLAGLFQDAVINVSEYDRQLALRYRIAPAKKLFTIHNGIDAAAIRFLNKEEARKALLTKLNPSLFTIHYSLFTARWVGSIGRLVAEKNYATLVEAAALLKSQMSNVKCQMFLIGDGYERPMLEKKIATLGLQNDVFLLGALPNAQQYLKAFDVFVMPSIKEGLPYTLIEAMAAGLPIVATRTGGIPEILEPRTHLNISSGRVRRDFLASARSEEEVVTSALHRRQATTRGEEIARTLRDTANSSDSVVAPPRSITVDTPSLSLLGLAGIDSYRGGKDIEMGSNGIIVTPREPSALADAIKKLLADAALQKTLSANARAYAERELTLPRMVQQTTAVYEHLNNR